MAQFYKVLKADPLGDPYESHGKSIQTYWCQFEGVDKAVSMGKQVPNHPQLGSHVYGDLMYAKSQKGTEYWKFKGSQVPEGVQRPADSPAQAQAQAATGAQSNMSDTMPEWFMPIANQIDYIFREMRKMDSDLPENNQNAAPATEATTKPTTETTAPELEVVGEPLDKETSNMLDDIFGKPGEEPAEPEPEK